MSSSANRSPQRGFTLLEVLIALAILTVSLLVLVDVQNTSALMSKQAEKMLVGTMLARDKLTEYQLDLENKGFVTQDVEEAGDFEEAYPGEFPEYRWEVMVRQMDASGAATGLGGLLDAANAQKDAQEESSGVDQVGGVEDQIEQGAGLLGMSPEFISEQLARFIREVRVKVIWTEGNTEDYVELVAHVVNPSGKVTDAQEQVEDQAEGAAQAGGLTQ